MLETLTYFALVPIRLMMPCHCGRLVVSHYWKLGLDERGQRYLGWSCNA